MLVNEYVQAFVESGQCASQSCKSGRAEFGLGSGRVQG